MNFLTAIFEAVKQIFVFGAKIAPSEKIQNGTFEIKKETLSEKQIKKIADERNKLADEMFGDLVGHPELSIEDKVNYEATKLDEKEKLLLIEILADRLNASPKYNRLKNKKFKFKL